MVCPVFRRIGGAIQRAARARLAAVGISSPAPESAILRSRYRAAVAALPADQKAVFMMHRVDDLNVSEIAIRLGMASSEVEVRLAAALCAIATALDGH